MIFDISRIDEKKSFFIEGFSYAGAPRSNTAMYITKKVEHLVGFLSNVKECLVFIETGIEIPDVLLKNNLFQISDNPMIAYAEFANQFAHERFCEEKKLKYNHTSDGYYVCEDCIIPKDAYIEPGCVIGPDVELGRNSKILAGTIIRRATIGDNFIANEHSVIGANGFTMAETEKGDKIRIPTLGRVIIGNNVEIGVHNNISCGSGGDTRIDDNVKLDALIHIGHDVHLHKNVEVTAGATFGGYVEALENSYVGVGSVLRNRITLGEHSFIGMGSNVTKSVRDRVTVAGNPAKEFSK